VDEAVSFFMAALALRPNSPAAHCALGNALDDKGALGEAIGCYRQALRLQPAYAEAHTYLGIDLVFQGKLDAAVASFKEALRLKPDDFLAHYNLGNALSDKGAVDEAIACYEETLRLKPDYGEAHCNLGAALQQKGQFPAALASFRRGHELGSRDPQWRYPSGQWVHTCEKLVELDARLPEFLAGKARPADASECIALAVICDNCKKLFVVAVRWYTEAFASEPHLASDLESGHRYNAACAAALAGCGQGKDSPLPNDNERARLRRQAFSWLRADLAAWRQWRDKEPNKAGPLVRLRMQNWREGTELAGVRGSDALGRLPEAERKEWQQLWQEVEALRQESPGPPASSVPARP
jgi:tetratricopeptide (TPR) repeat protein